MTAAKKTMASVKRRESGDWMENLNFENCLSEPNKFGDLWTVLLSACKEKKPKQELA
jgi:hypothetical protein